MPTLIAPLPFFFEERSGNLGLNPIPYHPLTPLNDSTNATEVVTATHLTVEEIRGRSIMIHGWWGQLFGYPEAIGWWWRAHRLRSDPLKGMVREMLLSRIVNSESHLWRVWRYRRSDVERQKQQEML